MFTAICGVCELRFAPPCRNPRTTSLDGTWWPSSVLVIFLPHLLFVRHGRPTSFCAHSSLWGARRRLPPPFFSDSWPDILQDSVFPVSPDISPPVILTPAGDHSIQNLLRPSFFFGLDGFCWVFVSHSCRGSLSDPLIFSVSTHADFIPDPFALLVFFYCPSVSSGHLPAIRNGLLLLLQRSGPELWSRRVLSPCLNGAPLFQSCGVPPAFTRRFVLFPPVRGLHVFLGFSV